LPKWQVNGNETLIVEFFLPLRILPQGLYLLSLSHYEIAMRKTFAQNRNEQHGYYIWLEIKLKNNGEYGNYRNKIKDLYR
jgi:hypothetical protein